MATKKKAEIAAENAAAAAVESAAAAIPAIENQNDAPQAATSASSTEQEAPEGALNGIDIKDTPLGDVEGDLVVVDARYGLNLRKGPNRSFPVVEVLENGSVLAVLALPYGAEVPGWALVHTGQRTGWVDISHLRELEE